MEGTRLPRLVHIRVCGVSCGVVTVAGAFHIACEHDMAPSIVVGIALFGRSEVVEKLMNQKNPIGKMLCYTGIGIIGCGVVGLLLNLGKIIDMMEYGELGSVLIASMLTGTVMSFIGGCAFFGFSEIIRLLSLAIPDTQKRKGAWDIRESQTYKMANGGE